MSVEILSGNELIIQGGLEAGFSLYTGYPGSPLADFFNILHHRKNELAEKGIKVVIANNEANAAAMASGAKQAGRDVLVGMKSMGLHVAADALSVGNFANPGPVDEKGRSAGVVIVVGDDPWSLSTSTPADSRYLYKHLHIPFFEPSTPQELKDWMERALELSKRTSVYVGVLLTTYMAEGGGRIEVGEEKEVDSKTSTLDPATFDLSKNVMVPPNSMKADIAMIKSRFPKIAEVMNEFSLDKVFGKDEAKIGILSAGVIGETLKQVLEEGQFLDFLSYYKLAGSYPLLPKYLLPWLETKETIIVVEEKRGFLEGELLTFIQKHRLNITVYGKEFNGEECFPAYGGLNYEIILEKLKILAGHLGLHSCGDLCHDIVDWDHQLPGRLPTFCPGCPHRETLSLLKDLRTDLKKEGVDLITHGDVGCYSLSFLPPFKEMHNLSAMGQGGALGAGVDIFTSNPSVVLMGDSTFYHSGITDVSNSVQLDHCITYILLNNDNTAMTGHQMSPSSGKNIAGVERPRQSMVDSVRSLGVSNVVEVNPSDRYFYKNILFDYIKSPGVKVIVSTKECALTFHARKKIEERKTLAKSDILPIKRFYQINTAVCEDCRSCVEMTGCPGLTQTKDAYGLKINIDSQICVSDGYCTKLKACPSFELVEVLDYHPTKYKLDDLEKLQNKTETPLPKPVKSFDDIASGEDLRIVVTGVGGSGVTTINRVLANAAKDMNGRSDLDFKYVDQKGLAQRNGNVTGHMAIFKKGKSYGAITPLGTADLLLSPDLLDGSRHVKFISPKGILILDKQFQIPLSMMLDNEEEHKVLERQTLKKKLRHMLKNRITFLNFKEISYSALGRSVYSSSMLLGAAFQSGRLPFTLENMLEAFKITMKKGELENNILAFQMGRKIYLDGDRDIYKSVRPGRKDSRVQQLKESLSSSFLFFKGKKAALKGFTKNLEKLMELFPEYQKDYLGKYLYDLYIYDRGRNVDKFVEEAEKISKLYGDVEYKRIALRTLARTYWVKDEIFVSHLMISKQKKFVDKARYKKLGKKYRIIHINRPSFDFWGRKVEFDFSPKDWMLRIMQHQRWLRKMLPTWHCKERTMNKKIRSEILNECHRLDENLLRKRLKKLENIKGFREVRYRAFDGKF